MKTKDIKNITKAIDVAVDLDNPRNPEEIATGKIIVEHKKNIFGSIDPEGKGNIKIDYSIDGGNIVIDRNLDLLSIGCMGKTGRSLNLKIERTNEIPFVVRLDSNAIIDCEDRLIDRFTINYTITAKVDKDNTSKSKSDSITVKLQKLTCRPEITLQCNEIAYTADTIENRLIFHNSNTHAYAPTISAKHTAVYLEKGTDRIDNVVSIRYSDAVSAGFNYDYVPKDVIIDDQDNPTPSDYVRRIFPKPGYEVDVPIDIDFSRVNNPTETSEEYKLVIDYEYWTDDSANSIRCQQVLPFILQRNDEQNELRVELRRGQQTDLINGDFRIPNPIDVISDWTHEFYIHIRNAATVRQTTYPTAGVVIRNLSIDGLSLNDNACAYRDGREIGLSQFVQQTIVGDRLQEDIIRLLPTDSSDITIVIRSGIINRFVKNGIDVFNATLCQHIRFEYYIDSTGSDNPAWTTYECNVRFDLEILPSPQWLGVDFGTSAVVALYGNSDDNAGRECNCICDLAREKRALLRAAYGNNSAFATVSDESVFINSNIVGNDGRKTENFFFGNRNNRIETDYKQGMILFSPGDQFAYDKLYPSLKSMMGHSRVPSKDPNPENRERMPLVDDVYQTAYNELFDLYLAKQSHGNPVERIVMTYPNTFATAHVEKLRQIAKKCMPTLRDGYIVTISESDAIACKYLRLRKQLIGGKNADQSVLVYDMGAGTLDITYFTNILRDGVREIDFVGKYGINKAGNYLDYVLAEIVVELCEQEGHGNIGGQNLREYISYRSDRSLDIGTCFELKKYVKNTLKPIMAQYEDVSQVPDDVMMPEWMGKEQTLHLTTIPLNRIFNHSKFKAFIKSVTQDVVDGCRANINNMMVDVVVFSGRMTCFKSIRKAFIDALGGEFCVMSIDIAGGMDNDSLKSSVVEGALDGVEIIFNNTSDYKLLSKRPFYCNYCVLVKLLDGLEVHCMLNNRTHGFKTTESVNLSNARAIYLLQTYAPDADSVKKDFDGDRDLTTILVARNVQDQYGLHDLTVKVEVNQYDRFNQGTNLVTLELDSGYVNAMPQENLESKAFRKSSWPVVFV
jgi:hypothetical protein